ncbi:hypothetical protein F5Y03DRAFT_47982 [Xylaria venustula]|nr:hypothetical protein F5Y03DRAFT_47982 [Xylaria venustula]
MPFAQEHLPPETSTGTGSSGYSFSSFNPLGFVLKSVASVTRPFRRTSDMNKPGNLGAPQPINTLSNKTPSSRTLFGVPSPRPVLSSPPPVKRQKVHESNTTPGHSRATFALVNTTPRKRSIGSESIADSQRSFTSNPSPSRTDIPEFRKVDKYVKRPRTRSNKSSPRFPAYDDICSRTLSSVPPLKSDDDISDDEVDLVKPSKKLASSPQAKRKRPGSYDITDFADRFQQGGSSNRTGPSQRFSKAIDNADEWVKHRKSDLSPDELALSDEEQARSRPAKRPKMLSSSLSKRGDILPTKFKGAATAGSSATMHAKCQQAADKMSEAALLIQDGLRISRGASGKCQYLAEYEEDPDYCALSIREIGHTLFPVDEKRDFLKPYMYLTLDISKAKIILWSEAEECLIVGVISDSISFANGAGPKLMIEFASAGDFSRFVEWVELYIEPTHQRIRTCERAKLEKDFDELTQRAKSHKILTDLELESSVPDDVRVIEHNHNSKPQKHIYAATVPKLRDSMQSASASRSNDNGVASSQAWDDQLASMPRPARTTRSTFAYYGSPEPNEPEPIPEGWTSLNPGWEKHWRNSLVYPNRGKNRATVDKDDISRLDEGQFLNDNIIIFYLRYLQKTLEEQNEGLAKRIYFQNTFFYDKLKPTKNSQGINYESVKTWTSKVDLFSKDYIIVPINEYTHWYVAIICNAPKLIPPKKQQEQDDDVKDDVNETADVVEVTPGSSRPPSRNYKPVGDNDRKNAASSEREGVVESLRRMPLSSPARPNVVTKHKTGNDKAKKAANSNPAESDPDVYEIKDSDRPETEIEHIATVTNPQARRKSGKRQSTGFRRGDPTQPRIITLDSLGASHSPTCSYLKQYLLAELKDKRGVEIPSPGAMGTTAKDVPEQTNHCDCGLFLLGYIQEFLRNPDVFVKSLLQRDGEIAWQFDPSKLRNDIRDLIFKLQRDQQDAEDETQEQKQQAKVNKQQIKREMGLSHTPAPATNPPITPSRIEVMAENCGGSEGAKSKSPRALPHSRPSSSRTSTTGTGDAALNATYALDFERSAKQSATDMEPFVPSVQNGDLGAMRHIVLEGCSDVEEMQARPKKSPPVTSSPRKTEHPFSREVHLYHRVPSISPVSPARSQATKFNPSSPGTEGSSNPQNSFLAPLRSETPSSKGSRGATPSDPVLVDDLNNNGQDKASQNPLGHRGVQAKHHLVVEIPSVNSNDQFSRPNEKTDGQKQTEHRSPYFLNRHDGERVVSAKLREPPQNDVIDLSGD